MLIIHRNNGLKDRASLVIIDVEFTQNLEFVVEVHCPKSKSEERRMLTTPTHESDGNWSAQKRIQWQMGSFCVVHLPLDSYVEVFSCSPVTLAVLLQRDEKLLQIGRLKQYKHLLHICHFDGKSIATSTPPVVQISPSPR